MLLYANKQYNIPPKMFSQGMKSFINSTLIYSETVISILMLILQKPQMCYLYCDTTIIDIRPVMASVRDLGV